MREFVGGKNTVGRMAAVLKKPHKATFNLFLQYLETYIYYKFLHFYSPVAFFIYLPINFFSRNSFPISLRLSILQSLNIASKNKDAQIVLKYEHWVQVNEPMLMTNQCMYKYVKLLYYKQRSLLQVLATYCGHLQGGCSLKDTFHMKSK